MKISWKATWEFLNKEFVVMVFEVMVLGLVASAITDRWQEKQRRAELQLNVLKEFNDKCVKVTACMMAPRAMTNDRECLVVEFDLLMMEDPIKVVFEDKSLAADFADLPKILTNSLNSLQKDEKWVLSAETFEKFRHEFITKTSAMRTKMLREMGASSA